MKKELLIFGTIAFLFLSTPSYAIKAIAGSTKIILVAYLFKLFLGFYQQELPFTRYTKLLFCVAKGPTRP